MSALKVVLIQCVTVIELSVAVYEYPFSGSYRDLKKKKKKLNDFILLLSNLLKKLSREKKCCESSFMS